MASAFESISATDYANRLDDQIWTLSHIAYRKYRRLLIGIWCDGVAVGAGLVALILEKRWL